MHACIANVITPNLEHYCLFFIPLLTFVLFVYHVSLQFTDRLAWSFYAGFEHIGI